jgi:hypothetical protein
MKPVHLRSGATLLIIFAVTLLLASCPIPDFITRIDPDGGAADFPDDPIGEWLFSGNLLDTSGNNNNGTLNGATLAIDRKAASDSAYSFDGNDWIKLPFTDLLPEDAYEISISFWMKADYINMPTPDDAYVFALSENNGTDTDLAMVFSPTDLANALVLSSGNISNRLAVVWNFRISPLFSGSENNSWKHVVIAWDAGSGALDFYIDGSLVTSDSLVITSSDFTMNFIDVGRRESQYFTGSLDDFRIYDRILTQAEITALYQE